MTTLTKKLKSEQQGKLLTHAKGVAINYDVSDTESNRKRDAIWNMRMDPIALYDCYLGTKEQESDYLSPLQQVKRMSELSKAKMQEVALGDAKEQKAQKSIQPSGELQAVSKETPVVAQSATFVAADSAAASSNVSAQQSQSYLVQAPKQVLAPTQAHPQTSVPINPPVHNATPTHGAAQPVGQFAHLQSSGNLQLAYATQPTEPVLTPVSLGATHPLISNANVATSQHKTAAPEQNQEIKQTAAAHFAMPAQVSAQNRSPFKASDEPKERLYIGPVYNPNDPFKEPESTIKLPRPLQLVTLKDFDKKYWFINRAEESAYGDDFAEDEWSVEWIPAAEILQKVRYDIIFDKPLEYGSVTLDPEFATYFFQHALAAYIPEDRSDVNSSYYFLKEDSERDLELGCKVCICDFMWQTPDYLGAKVLKDFANEFAIYPVDFTAYETVTAGYYDLSLHNHVFESMVRTINFCLNLEPLKKFAPQAKEICEFFMKSSFAWLLDRQCRYWLYECEVMRYFEFAPTVVKIYEKFRENGIEPRDAPTVDYILSKLLYKWAYFPLPFVEFPDYRVLVDVVYRSVCNAGYLVMRDLVGPLLPNEHLGSDDYWNLVIEDIHDYFSKNRELGDLLYNVTRPDKYRSAFYTDLEAAGRAHYEQVTGDPAPGKVFDFKGLEQQLLALPYKQLTSKAVLASLKEQFEQDKLAKDSKPVHSTSQISVAQASVPQTSVSQIPMPQSPMAKVSGPMLQQQQNNSIPSAFDQNYSSSQPDFSQQRHNDLHYDQFQVATPLYEHDGINVSDPSGFGLENFNIKLNRPVYDRLISEMSTNFNQGNALDPTRDDTTVSAMPSSGTQCSPQMPMQNQGGFNGQSVNQGQGMIQNTGYTNWQGLPQSGIYNQPQRFNQSNFNQQAPSRSMQGQMQGQRQMGIQGYGQPRHQQNYNQQRQVYPQNFGQDQRYPYQNQGQWQGYNQASSNNQYAGQGQMRPQGYNQVQNSMTRNMGGMNGLCSVQGRSMPMRGYNNQMQEQGQGQMCLRSQQGSNNWGNQNYQGQQGYTRNQQASVPQECNNQYLPKYNRGYHGNVSGSNVYANVPQNYNSGSQAYNRGSQGKGSGPQTYNQSQQRYHSVTQAADNFTLISDSGEQVYDYGPLDENGAILLDYASPEQINYKLGPQFCNSTGAQSFRQQNFDQGNFGNRNEQPQPQHSRFNQVSQSFNCSQGFNHRLQQLNQGNFGQGNVQSQPNQSRFSQSIQNFNNSQPSFEQNFSNGQNGLRSRQPLSQYNRSQGNYWSGQSQAYFNQSQNNAGSIQPQPVFNNSPQRNGNWQQSQQQPQAQMRLQAQPQAVVNQGQGAFALGSGMGSRAQSMGVNSNFGSVQQNKMAQPTVPSTSSAASTMADVPAEGQHQLAPTATISAATIASGLSPMVEHQNKPQVSAKELKKFRKTYGFDIALIELYKHAQRMGMPFKKQQSMQSMLLLLLETMFLKKIVVPELPPFEQLFSNVCEAVERAGRVPALRTKPKLKGDLDEPRYGLPFEFELQKLLDRFKQNQVEFFKFRTFLSAKDAMPAYTEQIEHLLHKSELYRIWLEDRHGHFKNGLSLRQMNQALNVIDEEYDSSAEYIATQGRKIKRSREEQIKYDYYTRIAQLEKAYSNFYLQAWANEQAIKDYATFRVRLAMREDLLLVFPDDEELYDLEFLGIEHDLKFMRLSDIYSDKVQEFEAILARAAQAKAERIAAREEARTKAALEAAEADYKAEMQAQRMQQFTSNGEDVTYGGVASIELPSGMQHANFAQGQAQATVLGDISGMEASAAAEDRVTSLRVQSGTKLLDASLEPYLSSDTLTIHSGSKVTDAQINTYVPVSLPSYAANVFANKAQASGFYSAVVSVRSGAQIAGTVSGAQAVSGAVGASGATSAVSTFAGTETISGAAVPVAAQDTKSQLAAKAAAKQMVGSEVESIQAEIVDPSQLKRSQRKQAQSSAVPHNRRELVASSSGSNLYADTLRNFKNRIKYPHFEIDYSSLAGAVRGSRLSVTMQGVETDFHVQPEERFEYDLGLQYATTLPDPRILLMDELKRLSDAKGSQNNISGRKRHDQDTRDYVHPVIAFLKANVLNGGAPGKISTHAITAAIAIIYGANVKSEIQIARIVDAELRAHNIEIVDQTPLLAEPEKWTKYYQVDLDGEVEDLEQMQKVRDLMQVLMQPTLPVSANGSDMFAGTQANNQGLANSMGQAEQIEEESHCAQANLAIMRKKQAQVTEAARHDISHLSFLAGAEFPDITNQNEEVVVGWRSRRDQRLSGLPGGLFNPFGAADSTSGEKVATGGFSQVQAQRYPGLEVVSDDEDMIITGPTGWRINEPEGYRRSKVNIYKTFDNFVPSPENQTVLDTAKRIVAAPDSQIFSPFYVYSASGLGKTHLIMAIANALHDMHPNKRVTYIRAEDFIYNYVLTVKQKNSRENRRYQDTDVFSSTLYTEILESDVVIVDDVQNFAKAQKSRDAFFEVVAAFLENPSHQLILASDVHPNELKKQGFNPRLTSRFAAGICYELVMPNVSSRRTIICAKSSEIGIKFSETLIDYMANNLGTNIREIEGAVKSVSSHVLINGCVSLSKAVRLVGSYIPVPKEKDKTIIPPAQIRNPHLTLAEIKRLVARAFSLSVSDLESSSRRKALSTARSMAMLLAKELLHRVTLCEIGKSFNRDHSSVIEAIQRIRVRIDNDVDLQRLYDFLTDKLTNPSKEDELNFNSSIQEQSSAKGGQDAGAEASNKEAEG